MDTTQFTHVSLCAGYGGIDLGLRRVLPGLRTIAYSEIEEYACGLLAARMESGHLDPAPIWSDLKTFPFSDFHGCVDILSGGYPCQPFSAAGKRRGTDDPRHLWPFIADGIRVCQPRMCFFENVEGHISLGLRDVLGDLERLGYATTWGIFSASEVGAPHQRKRVFILAHNANDRFQQPLLDGKSIESTQGYSIAGGDLPRVADAAGNDTECPAGAGPGSHKTGRAGTSGQFAGSDGDLWPARPGEPQHAWEPPRVVGTVSKELADFCSGNSQQRSNTAPTGCESVGKRNEKSDSSSDGGSGICRGDKEGFAAVADAVCDGRPKAERDAATMGDEERSEEGGKSESGPVASSADGGSSMGDADPRRLTSGINPRSSKEADRRGQGDVKQAESRPVEPALGRDADGPAGGLDYAELCVACDNRTDELRLLGNGVVPATVALAFRTLLTQLDHERRT